jgi:tRNA-dihydrouridine synthase
MIGRASFGNPWCFLPGKVIPTLWEVIDTMELHAKFLVENKWEKKGCMEIRKHLVQYLHSFPGVKEYRKRLVMVDSLDVVRAVLDDIRLIHKNELGEKFSRDIIQEFSETWWESC